MTRWLFLLAFAPCLLFAGSIRFYNDSPYKLRAVVRANDGSYLGEQIVLPHTSNIWTDQYSQYGPANPDHTKTPYTVHWYCLNGTEYGIHTNVATGMAVTANAAQGARMCAPPQNPAPQQGQQWGLQDQNSVPPYKPEYVIPEDQQEEAPTQ